MFHETCLVLTVVLLAVLQKGHGLQCWKCSSSQDVTCRDYFNETKIELNKKYFESVNYGNRQIQPVRTEPHVEVCDDMYTTPSYNYKNVCMKLVYKGVHGINEVIRGCRLVQRSHQSRSCPDEIADKSRILESCDICESDQCNSAGDVKTNLLLVTSLPTLIWLMLRK